METIDRTVEVITQTTYDDYRKYYMFSLFRGRLYKIGPILFFVISVLGITSSLFLGFSHGFDALTILLLALLSFLIILMIFLMFIQPKLYYKSARSLVESTTKYSFGEEYMIAETNSESTNGSSKIMYNALHKVCEIDDLFFIYISNVQAFVIPKKCCSPEATREVRSILQSKVKKYKNYSTVQ